MIHLKIVLHFDFDLVLHFDFDFSKHLFIVVNLNMELRQHFQWTQTSKTPNPADSLSISTRTDKKRTKCLRAATRSIKI